MRYIFGKIEDIICAICLIVMTSLTFANVIARYVFSASFSFSEEIKINRGDVDDAQS